MKLYDDQELFIQNIRSSFYGGHRRVIGVAPTGFGKTVCFSDLARRVEAKNKRIAILVHRDPLMEQVSNTLGEFSVRHNIISAGSAHRYRNNVSVASVFTLVRRLEHVPVPDMVIIDEAHHAISKSTWGKVLAHWSRALVLGVTATPCRLSGEGLNELFDEMVIGPTVAELIAAGRLSSYRIFAPTRIDTSGLHRRGGDWIKSEAAAAADKPTITGSAITHYKKHADGAPAVAFCVSIAHAHHVANDFHATGYRAVAIDGRMDKKDRREIIRDFRTGQIQVLTSCDLISEGFDCPGIVASIGLRPTASLGLYLQQLGRGLRIAPGKTESIILDHVGNVHQHGLPDEDRQWTLEGRPGNEKGVGVKNCPECFYIMPAHKKKCPDCGFVFPVAKGDGRSIDEVDGELTELQYEELQAQRERAKQRQRAGYEQSQCKTLEDFIDLGRARGYKNAVGWAKHVFHAKRKRRVA